MTPSDEIQQRVALSQQLLRTVNAAQRCVKVREASAKNHLVASADARVAGHAERLAELLAGLVEPAE
jgi:hypothetical protein